MRNNIAKYYSGFVRIRLECEESERFFRLCVRNSIQLWNINCIASYYECEMTTKDFFRIQPLRRKTKAKIKILEKHGVPFFFRKNKKRKAFFIGIGLFVFLLYACSLFIWEIKVEGNIFYSDEAIIEVLNGYDIKEGTKKSVLESGKIAEDLREIFPEFVWVSVRIDGTTLRIDIKENENKKFDKNPDMGAWDLVAKKDGIVKEIVTRVGMPKISVGEPCKKGDIIVSGVVEILDHDLNIKDYVYKGADADVLIETKHAYYDEFQLEYKEKIYNQKEHTYPFIQIGNHMFCYNKKKEQNTEYIQNSMKLRLTDSFYLPIRVGKIIVRPYEYVKRTYSEKEAVTVSNNRLRIYMDHLVKEDIEIINKSISISIQSGKCITRGYFMVWENAIEKQKIDQNSMNLIKQNKN